MKKRMIMTTLVNILYGILGFLIYCILIPFAILGFIIGLVCKVTFSSFKKGYNYMALSYLKDLNKEMEQCRKKNLDKENEKENE